MFQVDILAQRCAKGLQGASGVVFLAIETAINGLLNAPTMIQFCGFSLLRSPVLELRRKNSARMCGTLGKREISCL